MDDVERLSIELDYWDDAVGAFEPAKVVRQLQQTFPDAEIDPTDHQQIRLLRELENWSKVEPDCKQSWSGSRGACTRRTGQCSGSQYHSSPGTA